MQLTDFKMHTNTFPYFSLENNIVSWAEWEILSIAV